MLKFLKEASETIDFIEHLLLAMLNDIELVLFYFVCIASSSSNNKCVT